MKLRLEFALIVAVICAMLAVNLIRGGMGWGGIGDRFAGAGKVIRALDRRPQSLSRFVKR
ncbi:hypothetical protein [Sphingosinicella ginsenosidimutans]|uniref:Uncharacterized protein n=1 Tax=Allosphingosinicella ginsenosidimutans TaxID=1176539 RepID=A0A5C6TNK2_9SPHN|nr:hypothetical protein [Sphingosinicella ginsenosidimutans]TXC62033.1 hypothetical protein FRZ32_15125 [Sphingosinicella ginsenosidimutans]